MAETKVNKITYEGVHQNVHAVDESATSVVVQVYQRNLTGEHRLGTIQIKNPGGKKYKIYMQVDKRKGTLEVHIYDRIKGRWFDDIPLNERTYTL